MNVHVLLHLLSLHQAAHILVDNHVHRVAVVGHEAGGPRIQGIVTQGDVLHVLQDNVAALGAVAHASLGTLFRIDGHPFTMPVTATLRQCFQQLTAHGYHGCALVDSDGVIAANVSVADVRALSDVVLSGRDVNAVLDSLVLSFLRGDCGAEPAHDLVTVTPTDTLASLMELMTVSRVHRVHVVDRLRRPIGVVTMMDVIRLLMNSELMVPEHHGAGAGAGAPLKKKAAVTTLTPAPSPAIPTRTLHEEAKEDMDVEMKDTTLPLPPRCDEPSCPRLVAVFRALTALDFVHTDGVLTSDLVEINADSSISDAIRVMAEHHLSSLPVVREEAVSWSASPAGRSPFSYDFIGSPVTEKKYAGWLDYADVAAIVLSRNICSQKRAGIVSAVAAALTFDEEHSTVASMNFSKNNPFWGVPLDRRMDKVLVVQEGLARSTAKREGVRERESVCECV